MFLVHKKGFVPGKRMVDGLVPYDFFCEDNPSLNLFVFTGSATPGKVVEEQTLWGFTRLERFEALSGTLVSNKKQEGWFQKVNVLTGPAQNGTQGVKFQRVLKIIKHTDAAEPGRQQGRLRDPDRRRRHLFHSPACCGVVRKPLSIRRNPKPPLPKKRICTHPPFHHDAPF